MITNASTSNLDVIVSGVAKGKAMDDKFTSEVVESSPSGRGGVGGVQQEGALGLFDLLKEVRDDIGDAGADGVDYNALTSARKQVVQVLVDSAQARFQTVNGRTHVVSHKPSLLVQLLTMGARG